MLFIQSNILNLILEILKKKNIIFSIKYKKLKKKGNINMEFYKIILLHYILFVKLTVLTTYYDVGKQINIKIEYKYYIEINLPININQFINILSIY